MAVIRISRGAHPPAQHPAVAAPRAARRPPHAPGRAPFAPGRAARRMPKASVRARPADAAVRVEAGAAADNLPPR